MACLTHAGVFHECQAPRVVDRIKSVRVHCLLYRGHGHQERSRTGRFGAQPSPKAGLYVELKGDAKLPRCAESTMICNVSSPSSDCQPQTRATLTFAKEAVAFLRDSTFHHGPVQQRRSERLQAAAQVGDGKFARRQLLFPVHMPE